MIGDRVRAFLFGQEPAQSGYVPPSMRASACRVCTGCGRCNNSVPYEGLLKAAPQFDESVMTGTDSRTGAAQGEVSAYEMEPQPSELNPIFKGVLQAMPQFRVGDQLPGSYYGPMGNMLAWHKKMAQAPPESESEIGYFDAPPTPPYSKSYASGPIYPKHRRTVGYSPARIEVRRQGIVMRGRRI